MILGVVREKVTEGSAMMRIVRGKVIGGSVMVMKKTDGEKVSVIGKDMTGIDHKSHGMIVADTMTENGEGAEVDHHGVMKIRKHHTHRT